MSTNKATGLSVEENTARAVAGRKVAAEVRRRYIADLLESDDQHRFLALVERSRVRDDDGKYLSDLKLADILSARPGCTEATANAVLVESGFKVGDTIKNIRRGKDTSVPFFERLVNAPVDNFRARPQPPTGWPWSGKLILLLGAVNAAVPAELAVAQQAEDDDVEALLSEYVEETEETSELDELNIEDLFGSDLDG